MERKRHVCGIFLIMLFLCGCGKKEDVYTEGTSDVPVMMDVSDEGKLTGYVPDGDTKYFLECGGMEEEITPYVDAREDRDGITYWFSADLLQKFGYSVVQENDDILELELDGRSLIFEKAGNHYLVDGMEKSLSEAPEIAAGVLVLPFDALYGLGYQELDTTRYNDNILFTLSGQE